MAAATRSDAARAPGAVEIRAAVALFKQSFGGCEPAIVAVAPGRVNLIGEHTDYTDGFVLPMAIERVTAVALAANGLDTFRLVSANAPKGAANVVATFSREAMFQPPARGGEWHGYVRGVAAGFEARGTRLPCFDAAFVSSVPLGGGLSSSASLEVATACALESLSGVALSAAEKARLCQLAEHRFAHTPCGIMDQSISASAREAHAMLLDCRSLQPRFFKLADPAVAVLVTDSHVKHELSGGEYAKRRKDCEEALAALQAVHGPRIAALRDASEADLEAARPRMSPQIYRRALHVIGENARTLRAAEAFDRGDYATAGKLMNASHDSLRDNYQVSCREVDTLVELARGCAGVYGSRITGGGFGGCTVTLIAADKVEAALAAMGPKYREAAGKDATFMVTHAAAGARVVANWRELL
jgi:galactokinase